jgi:hypothetical protein
VTRRSRDERAVACMRAANPVSAEDLKGSIDEAHLARAMRRAILDGESPARLIPAGDRIAMDRGAADRRGRSNLAWRPARRIALAACIALIAAVAAAVVLGGRASDPVSRAYGAELVRFAESTPLLLLDGPGWRVEDVYEAGYGPYLPKGSQGGGSMQFVIGKPIPDESVRITDDERFGLRMTGMLPAGVRQRKVELSWRSDDSQQPWQVQHPVRLPVLDTTALVNTHAGRIVSRNSEGKHVLEPGKPGDRQMAATWSEDGYILEIRADVPDLPALAERLSWLKRVDSQTWLDAMPPNVVKAADHDAVVRELLKGVRLPSSFSPSRVPDEGLTTSRTQVANSVLTTVSCLWFRQWGEARRGGDRAAAIEAERAIETAPRWPLVREASLSETLLKLAKSIPSGVWQFGPHRWRLLPKAEGLGCARLGIPVLPRKIKRQQERRPPPPPA